MKDEHERLVKELDDHFSRTEEFKMYKRTTYDVRDKQQGYTSNIPSVNFYFKGRAILKFNF